MKTQQCRFSGNDFLISQEDLGMYEKIGVPPPMLCPEELWRNLFAFRNEWNLFQRTCSSSGKNIISCYRPDTTFPVYDHGIWWSDDWSAAHYGKQIDFEQPFFPQYASLQSLVPRP
jgi:hypothetical protein